MSWANYLYGFLIIKRDTDMRLEKEIIMKLEEMLEGKLKYCEPDIEYYKDICGYKKRDKDGS